MKERLAVMAAAVLLLTAWSGGPTSAQVNAAAAIFGQRLFGDLHTNAFEASPFGAPRPSFLNSSSPPLCNGFHALYCRQWPLHNLTSENALNCEYFLNGKSLNPDYTVNPDSNTLFFAPRYDYCLLSERSLTGATIRWSSQWSYEGLDMSMRYQMTATGIDLAFSAVPHQQVDSTGWIGIMWASYMNGAITRHIHFYGCKLEPTGDPGDNSHQPVVVQTGWMAMGDGTASWSESEVGVVPMMGVPYLSHGTHWQGFVNENKTYRFLYPFYYGLIDGDGDLSTPRDAMAWIVMFDQDAPIRLTMFNFKPDPKDPAKANIHQPAWDWQYIIRDPHIGQTYGYKARVIYKAFVSEDDVMQEYLNWKKELGDARASEVKLYTGDSHTFTADGDVGSGTRTFQWKWADRTGVVHNGPTTAAWALSDITATNRGAYWCEVTRDGAKHWFNTAALSVEDHLEAAMPVAREIACAGDSYTFGIQTSGGYAPLLYVWKKDGAFIPDASASSYTRPCLTESDTGTYTVEVADSNTDYRSNTATLSVKKDGAAISRAHDASSQETPSAQVFSTPGSLVSSP